MIRRSLFAARLQVVDLVWCCWSERSCSWFGVRCCLAGRLKFPRRHSPSLVHLLEGLVELWWGLAREEKR